jgi:hypothetical protein
MASDKGTICRDYRVLMRIIGIWNSLPGQFAPEPIKALDLMVLEVFACTIV